MKAKRKYLSDILPYLILFALACIGLPATGRTIYVSPAGTNDYDGYYPNWAGASTSIAAAVTRASANDQIWVTNVTYKFTAGIYVDKAITIRSYNNGSLDCTNTIIDCQGLSRAFMLDKDGILLAGFTISNGYSTSEAGAGVFMYWGTISNCIITDCNTALAAGATDNASCGAGLRMSGSTLAAKNCVIQRNRFFNSSNSATLGGGGVLVRSGALLKDCEIIGNSVASTNGRGGGVFIWNGGTVENCRVISNTVTSGNGSGNGGGISVFNNAAGNILITNCTIAGNTAQEGGGISWPNLYYGGIITDCAISNNAATNASGKCGGIGLCGYYTVKNCKIMNNRAGDSSAGAGAVWQAKVAMWGEGNGSATACVIQGNYPHGVAALDDTTSLNYS